MAEIYEFKKVVREIFIESDLGEKYLDLSRNEWSRSPDTNQDYEHLAVILHHDDEKIEMEKTQDEMQNLWQPEIQKYNFFKEAKSDSLKSFVK